MSNAIWDAIGTVCECMYDSYKRVCYYKVRCAYCGATAYVKNFDPEYTCDWKCALPYRDGLKRPEVIPSLYPADAPIYHDLSRQY